MNNENSVPFMTDSEREAFHKNVESLFKAGWRTDKIRDWAIGSGSGFARFWTDPQHALDTINAIARAYNAKVRADNAECVRLAEEAYRRAEPKLVAAMEAAGFRMKFRSRK